MTLSLRQLDEGIDKLVQNSADLVMESEALLRIGRYARSLALAHLAREEMSKAIMLYAAGLRILAKHKVDWKQLTKRLRNHQAKLRLEILDNFLQLKEFPLTVEDVKSGMKISAIAKSRNNLKNSALYVGFANGTFTLPSDAISQEQAERNLALATIRLREVEYECLRSPRLSEREIGSLASIPDLANMLEALDDDMLAKLRDIYASFHPFAAAPSDGGA